MASRCSGRLGHTLLLYLFSNSALAHPSHQLHPRERFFLEAAISWKSQRPVKVAGHRRHVLDTTVDLYHPPCLCAYCLEELLQIIDIIKVNEFSGITASNNDLFFIRSMVSSIEKAVSGVKNFDEYL